MRTWDAIRTGAPITALLGLVGLIGLTSRFFPILKDLDMDTVASAVEGLGIIGPLAVIAFMIIAIVASPIPSAPIALAAGAAYGHVAGTIYVVIGAELGALFAFVIARFLGRRTVERFLGTRLNTGLLGSQNALTLTVFVSRLLPFISFDAMSYVAGLSQLNMWRFLLATLAGIIPVSFSLAYLGAGAASAQLSQAAWVVVGLGLITASPILLLALFGPSPGTRNLNAGLLSEGQQ
jgi:uncharacterized membrane protein YdjX (TVP38/TMEM64 family)